MKVVKAPDSKPWKTSAECTGDKILKKKGCGAKLEICEKDLKLFYWYGTHFRHEYLSVRCPVCGVIVRLKVPDYLYDQWKKKHPRAQGEFDGFDDRI